MILTGRNVVSPFGADTNRAVSNRNVRQSAAAKAGLSLAHALRNVFLRPDNERRVRKTVIELSKLDNHMLRDIGLNRAAIISAAHEAENPSRDRSRRTRR